MIWQHQQFQKQSDVLISKKSRSNAILSNLTSPVFNWIIIWAHEFKLQLLTLLCPYRKTIEFAIYRKVQGKKNSKNIQVFIMFFISQMFPLIQLNRFAACRDQNVPTKFSGAKVIFLVRGIVEYLENHQQKNNSRI